MKLVCVKLLKINITAPKIEPVKLNTKLDPKMELGGRRGCKTRRDLQTLMPTGSLGVNFFVASRGHLKQIQP